jgi:glutathione S-transferase
LNYKTPSSLRATSRGLLSACLSVKDRIRDRLRQLSARLGDADWLDGAFSAGDLIMVSVLLRLKASGLLDEYPNLSAYVARGEARPAYKRAFDAQLAVNTGKPPTA